MLPIWSFLTLARKRTSESLSIEETESYLHSGELCWYGQFCAFHTESTGEGNKARQAESLARRLIWGLAVVAPFSSPTTSSATNTRNSGQMCGKWRWSKKWKKASQESSKRKREKGGKSSSCGSLTLEWWENHQRQPVFKKIPRLLDQRLCFVLLISYQGTLIMEDKKLLEEIAML